MDPSDPDFQYLGVDRKALLKEAESGGFDSKSVAWVEDEKEGYVLADIVETSGDTVTVKLKDGNVCSTSCPQPPFPPLHAYHVLISM